MNPWESIPPTASHRIAICLDIIVSSCLTLTLQFHITCFDRFELFSSFHQLNSALSMDINLPKCKGFPRLVQPDPNQDDIPNEVDIVELEKNYTVPELISKAQAILDVASRSDSLHVMSNSARYSKYVYSLDRLVLMKHKYIIREDSLERFKHLLSLIIDQWKCKCKGNGKGNMSNRAMFYTDTRLC